MAKTRGCEICEEQKPIASIERVQISSGRDYPGVGGGMSPPEYAFVCEDCRDERERQGRRDEA